MLWPTHPAVRIRKDRRFWVNPRAKRRSGTGRLVSSPLRSQSDPKRTAKLIGE
jgi:hypothetical protein